MKKGNGNSNEFNKELAIKKLQELSGIKKSSQETLNESKSTESKVVLKYKKALDGCVYGVIREGNHYFIKKANQLKENFSASDFVYIGGQNAKHNEEYESFIKADQRLNNKIVSINEMYNRMLPIKEEIPLNKNIDKEKEAEPIAPVTPVQNPEPTTSVDPNQPSPEEPSTETPAGPEETPAPDAMASPEPTPDASATPETPAAEATPGEPGAEEGDDTSSEIQSLLGQLTQKYRETPDLSVDQAKTAINSIISATKSAIPEFTPEDKEKITKRLQNNGEKLDEENAEMQTEETIDGLLREYEDYKKEMESSSMNESKKKYISNLIEKRVANFKKNGHVLNESSSKHSTNEKLNKMISKIDSIIAEEFQKINNDKTIESLVEKELKSLKEESEHIEIMKEDENKAIELKKKIADLSDEWIKANPEEYKKLINSYMENIKAGTSNASNSNIKSSEMVSEEDTQSEINSLQQGIDIAKQLMNTEQAAGDATVSNDASLQEDKTLNEGILSNLNTTAKIFLIAGFLSVLGGKVNAAVDQYEKSTGEKASKEIVQKAVETLKSKQSPDLTGGDGGEGDGEEQVTVKKQISPYKRLVDKISDKMGEKFQKAERGADLRNKAVMDKADNELDINKDTERLEKTWRMLSTYLESSQDPEQAVKDLQAKYPKLNVKLTPEGKVTFDFKYNDADTKDGQGNSLKGKTIPKLVGSLVKSDDKKTVEKEQDWVKVGKGIEVNFNKLQGDDYKNYSAKLKAEPEKFKKMGNNFYIYNDAGKWVDSDKVQQFLQDNPEYILGDTANPIRK